VPLATSSESTSDAFAAAGLLPFILQGLLVLLLVAILQGVPFTRPRSDDAARRRAFREHVEAVGRLLARGRQTRAALALFVPYALERLRAAAGRSLSGSGSTALASALSTRVGEDEATLAQVIERAEAVRADGQGRSQDPHTRATELALLQRLAQLVRQTRSPAASRRDPRP